MPIVDALLRLAASQDASELIFRAGEPPALRGRKGLRPLSMPTMDEAAVRAALAEVVGDESARDEGDVRRGAVRVRWRRADRLEVSIAQEGASRGPEPARAPPSAPVRAPEPSYVAPVRREQVAAHEASGALARIAAWARAHDASDVVLVDGRPIAARVHGAMIRGDEVLAPGAVSAMIDPFLDDRRRARLDEEGSADVPLVVDGARYRANRFRALAGDSAVLRPVREVPPTLRGLALPDALARFAELHDGLVLVTGPAGSGKSTTLVAMIEHLNRNHPRHVVTLEDPIEYVFASERAVVHQRELGTHVSSFADGLRAALREAPDVILLGELRDAETIAAALTAAETGHLVLATLHAGSTAGAIDRIVDAMPDSAQRQVRTQLGDVLRVVLGQRLLPSRAGARVPAVEILPVTPAVSHLIREGKAFQIPQVLQTGREQGMVPFARAVADLVRAGAVDRATALRSVPDPQLLIDALGGR